MYDKKRSDFLKTSGISTPFHHNSGQILKTIIDHHPLFVKLRNEDGMSINKSFLLRCGLVDLLKDPCRMLENSHILKMCVKLETTQKLFTEFKRELIPDVILFLKDKNDNKQSSISAMFTSESVAIIHKIISSNKFKVIFKSVDMNMDRYISQKYVVNGLSVLYRASLCYLLNRLDDMEKNPATYQKMLTLRSTENALKKIDNEQYSEDL